MPQNITKHGLVESFSRPLVVCAGHPDSSYFKGGEVYTSGDQNICDTETRMFRVTVSPAVALAIVPGAQLNIRYDNAAPGPIKPVNRVTVSPPATRAFAVGPGSGDPASSPSGTPSQR